MYKIEYHKKALKEIQKLKQSKLQHRLVYKVIEEEGIVRIISMWSHYENV